MVSFIAHKNDPRYVALADSTKPSMEEVFSGNKPPEKFGVKHHDHDAHISTLTLNRLEQEYDRTIGKIIAGGGEKVSGDIREILDTLMKEVCRELHHQEKTEIAKLTAQKFGRSPFAQRELWRGNRAAGEIRHTQRVEFDNTKLLQGLSSIDSERQDRENDEDSRRMAALRTSGNKKWMPPKSKAPLSNELRSLQKWGIETCMAAFPHMNTEDQHAFLKTYIDSLDRLRLAENIERSALRKGIEALESMLSEKTYRPSLSQRMDIASGMADKLGDLMDYALSKPKERASRVRKAIAAAGADRIAIETLGIVGFFGGRYLPHRPIINGADTEPLKLLRILTTELEKSREEYCQRAGNNSDALDTREQQSKEQLRTAMRALQARTFPPTDDERRGDWDEGYAKFHRIQLLKMSPEFRHAFGIEGEENKYLYPDTWDKYAQKSPAKKIWHRGKTAVKIHARLEAIYTKREKD